MEIEKSLRHRINIKETAKKDKYWDCTVDGTNYTLEEVLAESDKLVKALEEKYPAEA